MLFKNMWLLAVNKPGEVFFNNSYAREDLLTKEEPRKFCVLFGAILELQEPQVQRSPFS